MNSLSNVEDLEKFIIANSERKIIIDVSKEFMIQKEFINYLENKSKDLKNLILLSIQSGSSKKSVINQTKLMDKINHIIALTKLDENIIEAEELSNFSELNIRIGLLSSSKNIIDSLAFTKDEILAQYMKEI